MATILCTQPFDPALRGLPPRDSKDYLTSLEDLLVGAQATVHIVCPFIDGKGTDILRRAWARTGRTAIWEIYTRRAPAGLLHAAADLGWIVYEYVGTPGGDERRGFHCKLFIADDRRAILGSVNLIYENLVENLELGVLLEGDEVQPLLDVPRAVRRASSTGNRRVA